MRQIQNISTVRTTLIYNLQHAYAITKSFENCQLSKLKTNECYSIVQSPSNTKYCKKLVSVYHKKIHYIFKNTQRTHDKHSTLKIQRSYFGAERV